MGNTQKNRTLSSAQRVELTEKLRIPLSSLKLTVDQIQTLVYSDKYNLVYVVYKKSKKILKYNLLTMKLDETYRFNTTPIRLIELDRNQTRLYTVDQNTIKVIDTESNVALNTLFGYQSEDHIDIVKFFNYRYIAISLKNSKLFEVFDVISAVREGKVYNKGKSDHKLNFRAFGCSYDSELFSVLDAEYIYVFDLHNMKEISRRPHSGKETDILYVMKDKKHIFTLANGYIRIRKLKSLEKVKKFKFKKFKDSSEVQFMENDRALIIRENDGLRFVDLTSLENICYLEDFSIKYFFLCSNDKYLFSINDKNIIIYKFENYINEMRHEELGVPNTKIENTKKTSKTDFTCSYKKIYQYVRQGYIDLALIECRKIIRINTKEHKAYFITGKLLYLRGIYEASLEFINQAIYLSNQTVSIYFIWKGKLLFCLEKYHEAIEAFNKALFLDPKQQAATKNIGVVQKRMRVLKISDETQTRTSYPSFPTDAKLATIDTFNYEDMFDKAFTRTKSQEKTNAGGILDNIDIKAKSVTRVNNSGIRSIFNNKFDFWDILNPFSNNTPNDNTISNNLTQDLKTENLNRLTRPFIDKSFANFINTDDELSLASEDSDDFAIFDKRNTAPVNICGDISRAYPVTFTSIDHKVNFELKHSKKIASTKGKQGDQLLVSEQFHLIHPTRNEEISKFM